MKFYITGDTHGDFCRVDNFCRNNETDPYDVMIVLGDAGLNYYGDKRDKHNKYRVFEIPITFFCIHGNHEMRPTDVPGYRTKEFCGGTVWYEEKYPNILFAKDGEIYTFGDYRCIVIGGAYSVDKWYRLERGWNWFANEQPDDEIKAYVEKQLAENENKIDVVLSHTCPLKYEPVEVFMGGVDQSKVDKSTEKWLDTIEERIEYKKWYCGHYHTAKRIDRMQFMFEDIDELNIGEGLWDRSDTRST